MERICRREFTVNYFVMTENRWRIVSQLQDEVHDITVTVDVAVPEMVIMDAGIVFERYPLEYCTLLKAKAKELIGVRIMEDYRNRCLGLFMGPEGCPNIMTLLSVSVPGFPYFYYPHLIKNGKLSREEWDEMVRTRFTNDCLAHKLEVINSNERESGD